MENKIKCNWGGVLARITYRQIMKKNNADIPLDTKIEGPIMFPYGISRIFLSRGASIGSGCEIFHQVTIGSNTLNSSKGLGSPRIGNNVYIGCGAKIIGGCRIGNNVRIGANCVVVNDIEDNSTVVLPRPRIIKHKYNPDNRFIPYNDYAENAL